MPISLDPASPLLFAVCFLGPLVVLSAHLHLRQSPSAWATGCWLAGNSSVLAALVVHGEGGPSWGTSGLLLLGCLAHGFGLAEIQEAPRPWTPAAALLGLGLLAMPVASRVLVVALGGLFFLALVPRRDSPVRALGTGLPVAVVAALGLVGALTWALGAGAETWGPWTLGGVSALAVTLSLAEVLALQGLCQQREQRVAASVVEATEAIHRERDASVSRLIASVSHSMNTPLGSLVSSGQSLSSALETLPLDFARAWSEWSPEDRAILEELVGRLTPLPVGIPNIRQRRTALSSQVQTWGLTADAEVLVLAGVDQDPRLLARIARSARATDLVTFAARLSEAQFLADAVAGASLKAALVVETLGNWFTPAPPEVALVNDLGTTVLDAVDRFRAVWPEVDLTVTLAPGRRMTRVPTRELSMVWDHLLTNAAQAVGNRGQVVLTLSEVDGRAVVEVEDRGPGISPELQPLLFQPFVSLQGSGKGVGLGLFFSHRFLEEWKGALTFRSAEGRTVFRAEIPLVS